MSYERKIPLLRNVELNDVIWFFLTRCAFCGPIILKI